MQKQMADDDKPSLPAGTVLVNTGVLPCQDPHQPTKSVVMPSPLCTALEQGSNGFGSSNGNGGKISNASQVPSQVSAAALGSGAEEQGCGRRVRKVEEAEGVKAGSDGVVQRVLRELTAVRSEQASLTSAFLAAVAEYRQVSAVRYRGVGPRTNGSLGAWTGASGFLSPLPAARPAGTTQQPTNAAALVQGAGAAWTGNSSVPAQVSDSAQSDAPIGSARGEVVQCIGEEERGREPVVAPAGRPPLQLSARTTGEELQQQTLARHLDPFSPADTTTEMSLQEINDYGNTTSTAAAVAAVPHSARCSARRRRSAVENCASGNCYGRRPARVLWVEALRRSHAASASAAAAAAATAEAAAASTACLAGAEYVGSAGDDAGDGAIAECYGLSGDMYSYGDTAADGLTQVSSSDCLVS